MQIPETVEVERGQQPDASVIWLHGLGADGHDFEPLVPQLDLAPDLCIRFVFPHAPMRPVTINGGMTMRAWYDILSLDRTAPQDETGIRDSATVLEWLVEREQQRGCRYDRIVLAGFSQGGAIALYTAVRFPQRLAGVIALSTYLPLAESFPQEFPTGDHARALPILMAHGTYDPMLPVALGQTSRQVLQSAGYRVEWHEYPMAHAVCAEEVAAVSAWLNRVLRDDVP